MSYAINERYWVPDDEDAWLCGTLKEFKNGVLEFSTEKGIKKLKITDLKVKLDHCGSHIDTNTENLVDLDELSEGAILHHVRNRFQKKIIYTHVGAILVAVNPFENLPIYSEQEIRKALNNVSSPYPHVYLTASTAYHQMINNKKNQSILISGESGAGKTETTKKVLTFLTNVAPSHVSSSSSSPNSPSNENEVTPGMEEKILQSNPLLEALGNSKTLRNNNSSRFGKWMKVIFNKSGHIIGCEIINYLLEKSRVVFQSKNERNYHIFYQLINGSDSQMKQRLHIKNFKEYNYLIQSQCFSIPGVDDAAEFQEVMLAMKTLQFSSSTIESMFKIFSAILLLGNVEFESNVVNNDISVIKKSSEDLIKQIGELLALDLTLFKQALIEKRVQMGKGSLVNLQLSISQAIDNRDTLSKALYSLLFDWVIQRVNLTLKIDRPDSTILTNNNDEFVIGILDIFGFEVFEVNSFEQLCINYANEKLQFHFNEVIFEEEKLMYLSEGIRLDDIKFEDNSECVNLIEGKPIGLLSLLDEECSLGNGTELSYIAKLEKSFSAGKSNANKYFIKSKTKTDSFSISHFAGPVEYYLANFLEKNRDTLSLSLRELMSTSKIPLVSELFPMASQEDTNSKNKSTSAKQTLGAQFRAQLIGLVTNLKTTEPHFIRCVKPNHAKVPSVFDGNLALRQLRYAGLFEAIRIRKSGYAYRSTFNSFANQYSILVDGLMKKREKNQIEDREACQLILNEVTSKGLLPKSSCVVGTQSKVFLKNNSDRMVLERGKQQRIGIFVSRIQEFGREALRRCRRYHSMAEERKEIERRKKLQLQQIKSAIIIQKYWRRKSVLILLASMQHLIELRRVLPTRNINKIREILNRIEREFPALAYHPNARPFNSSNSTSASSKTSQFNEKEAIIYNLFAHELKVAKVMLKLFEVQTSVISSIQNSLAIGNISQLNQSLLKAQRLEMEDHPVVKEGQLELQNLYRKRVIIKELVNFVENHDNNYSIEIKRLIFEAKKLNIDINFIEKVERIYENTGPRLQARNRLRDGIEHINIGLIERSVVDIFAIREHHEGFAESEIRAAKMLLRLLDFDKQLYPELYEDDEEIGKLSQKYIDEMEENKKTKEIEKDSDVDEENESHGYNEDVESKEHPILWGRKITLVPTKNRLPEEIISLCERIGENHDIADLSKLNKQTLREASGDNPLIMYSYIRYFKWHKTLCVWKYPELLDDDGMKSLNNSSKAPSSPSSPLRSSMNPSSPLSQRNNGSNINDLSLNTSSQSSFQFFDYNYKQARSNTYIIRSLHHDFDMYTMKTKNSSLEAAISAIQTNGSINSTLKNLNNNNNIDKKIVLPNGKVFQKTVLRNNTTSNNNSLFLSSTTSFSSFNSPNKTFTKQSSANFTSPISTRTRTKEPVPITKVKRVEELDPSDLERQLYESRLNKEKELNKVKHDLKILNKQYKSNWK